MCFWNRLIFKPISIAKTGRLLNAESDSRQLPLNAVLIRPAAVMGNEIATRLILDICGGEASELVIAGQEPDWQKEIDFDWNQVKRLTGMDIPQEKMISILEKLGFRVNENKLAVPSWRSNDISCNADIVEEIVRINGLDELPTLRLRAEQLPDLGFITAAKTRSRRAAGIGQPPA